MFHLLLTRPVWESAVEFAPLTYYTMMLGGPNAPGVQKVLNDVDITIPEVSPLPLDPTNHNWHWVEVQNPGQAAVLHCRWIICRSEPFEAGPAGRRCGGPSQRKAQTHQGLRRELEKNQEPATPGWTTKQEPN